MPTQTNCDICFVFEKSRKHNLSYRPKPKVFHEPHGLTNCLWRINFTILFTLFSFLRRSRQKRVVRCENHRRICICPHGLAIFLFLEMFNYRRNSSSLFQFKINKKSLNITRKNVILFVSLVQCSSRNVMHLSSE